MIKDGWVNPNTYNDLCMWKYQHENTVLYTTLKKKFKPGSGAASL